MCRLLIGSLLIVCTTLHHIQQDGCCICLNWHPHISVGLGDNEGSHGYVVFPHACKGFLVCRNYKKFSTHYFGVKTRRERYRPRGRWLCIGASRFEAIFSPLQQPARNM